MYSLLPKTFTALLSLTASLEEECQLEPALSCDAVNAFISMQMDLNRISGERS